MAWTQTQTSTAHLKVKSQDKSGNVWGPVYHCLLSTTLYFHPSFRVYLALLILNALMAFKANKCFTANMDILLSI